MGKQFYKDGLGWGFVLYLIRYALSIMTTSWIILPISATIALLVLFKEIKSNSFLYYFFLAIFWTLMTANLDYWLIVKVFNPEDGYYKLDVYLYYILTFALPLFVGWRKKIKTTSAA